MHPTKESLISLIDRGREGKVVLPHFQRSFIWDRQSIEELLVSILNDYFVGSLLILNVLPDDLPFEPRKLEGVEDGTIHATKMVLDGQQRLTSAHYALYGPDENLKGTSYPYRFFLRIRDAVEGRWDDAVYSVPTYYKQKGVREFEDPTLQYENGIVAFSAFRSWEVWDDWFEGYQDYHKERDSYDDALGKELKSLARRFLGFEVALVELPHGTDLETVVEIFERINRTGESLSVFELLTARLWKHDINLRELWEETRAAYPEIDEVAEDKSERYPKFTLQVIALLRGQECKRRDLILLEGDGFEEDWETATRYVAAAIRRIRSTGSGGYGVVPAITPPYSTMATPLAAILQKVETEHAGDPRVLQKVHRWYWSSVFSERYGGSVESLAARDYQDMRAWFDDDGRVPDGVLQDLSPIKRDLRDVVRAGAVYKGVLSLVALAGARDFYSADTIELHQLDDHHIFPKKVLRDDGYEPDQQNTILNRTLISSQTNRSFIGAKRPSVYLEEMIERHGEVGARRVLATHLVDEEAFRAMRTDDYPAFLEARERALRNEIERRCLGGDRARSERTFQGMEDS